MQDVKAFLVSASDGYCCALLEFIAMVKPALVARRGMLTEIVDDGANGFLIDDTPDNLAAAILKLAGNESSRRKMGDEAKFNADSLFSLRKQGEIVNHYYDRFQTGH